MTRKELTKAISKQSGIGAMKSARFVDLVFETVAQILEKGEPVNISGFGKFTVRNKRARMGRNPRTGVSLQITPRRVVTFQPSHLLRKPIGEKSLDQGGGEKPSQELPEKEFPF